MARFASTKFFVPARNQFISGTPKFHIFEINNFISENLLLNNLSNTSGFLQNCSVHK